MSTILTIRTDEALRDALAKRASAQGKSVSEVAREILRGALEERALEERTSHLKGRLRLGHKQTEAWRRTLRQHNWRA
jgi:plasmid stability protein